MVYSINIRKRIKSYYIKNKNLEVRMGLAQFLIKIILRKKILKLIDLINTKYSKRNSVKIMDEEWDYLIILDACRYDIFTWFIHKEVPFVISGGTTTSEWIFWNFNGIFNDVVYIATNPRLSSLNLRKVFKFNPFFKVIELWDFGWDDKLKTIPPNEVTKETINALKEFPNKRMIIHFNQPHFPFIGDKDLIEYCDILRHKTKYDERLAQPGISLLLAPMKEGKLSMKRIWKAYIKTFLIAMKEVYKIVQELQGKVIITSDHGDLFGEYLLYGHHMNLRAKKLVKVPWFVIKDEKKKDPKQEIKIARDRERLEMDLIKEKIKNFKRESKI